MLDQSEITLEFVRQVIYPSQDNPSQSAKSADIKIIGARISMNKPRKICQNVDTVKQTTPEAVRQPNKSQWEQSIKEKGCVSWKRFP